MRISLVLLFPFLISCESDPEQILEVDFEDLVVDTLFLEKSPMTKELDYDFSFFETEDNRIVLKTFIDGTLYEYSYPNGRILRTQDYEQEGPDGIGSFVQGYFIEEEFIWFLSELNLIKADHFGKIIARYTLPEAEENRQSANYSTRMGAKVFRTGSSLLIPDAPFVLNEQVVQYEDWILEFDPEANSFEYLSFQWPENYQQFLNDPGFGRYQNSYLHNQNLMVVSLPASDSLIVIRDDGNKNVFAGTSEPMNYLKGGQSQQGEWVVFFQDNNSSKYSGISWAEKEQVLLRLAIPIPDTEENREDGKIPSVKMLVLDSSLRLKAEIDMPFETGGFNTPDGFYTWIGNPHSEDEVAYVRLSFDDILK